MGEGDQARLHFYIGASEERLSAVSAVQLEEAVAGLIRTWGDRVLEGLLALHAGEEAERLAAHYEEAFSREYQAAATADVAATLIAGSFDCPGAAGVERVPARDLDPDSDLGDRLVTVAVPQLGPAQIDGALAAGGDLARHMMKGGQIAGAVMELQGRIAVIGLDDPAAALVNAQDFTDRTMNEED